MSEGRHPGRPWLVVGATGFVGRHLGRALDEAGLPWIGTRRAPGEDDALEALDLPAPAATLDRLLSRHRPAVVALLAGHHPGASEAEMTALHRDGATGLLDAVRRTVPDARVIVLGSAAELGESDDTMGPPGPVSPYGRAKAAATEAVLSDASADLDVTVARLYNAVGPDQGPGLAAGAILARLADGERPLRLSAADAVRDWIDVRDAARALVALGQAETPPRLVDLATGRGVPVAELGRILVELAGGELVTVPRRPEEGVARSVGDPSGLEALGATPEIPLRQSLEDQWRAAGSPRQEPAE
jgi:nucleoside-diphosphate-sugar epimerase